MMQQQYEYFKLACYACGHHRIDTYGLPHDSAVANGYCLSCSDAAEPQCCLLNIAAAWPMSRIEVAARRRRCPSMIIGRDE